MHEIATWFATTGRDLPWRGQQRDPWAVVVSETMLQQTQVDRVVPYWVSWMDTWPTPADLAAEPTANVLRAWGRLGYPRRALRLQETAGLIRDRHHNQVPDSYDALVALPGVGDYTANAVLAFAFRQRVPVLDTNVRRVLARTVDGEPAPSTTAPTKAERQRTLELLPAMPANAAVLSEALMELGALVCTSKNPNCDACPVRPRCAWRQAGSPAATQPPLRARQRAFAGSDRQVRGIILAALRDHYDALTAARFDLLWPDQQQLQRARNSLLDDGLVVIAANNALSLPV